MGFASDDDDDDIYDSKRFKDQQTWLEQVFGTVINTNFFFRIYSITDINQSR